MGGGERGEVFVWWLVERRIGELDRAGSSDVVAHARFGGKQSMLSGWMVVLCDSLRF